MATVRSRSAASAKPRAPVRPKKLVGKTLHLLALIAVLFVTVFPFYWMVSTSLKTTVQTFANPPVFVSHRPLNTTARRCKTTASAAASSTR